VTYIYAPTHIYKTFFYAIRKFYFVTKKKTRNHQNYHSSERESSAAYV